MAEGRVEFNVVIRCDDIQEARALYKIAKRTYEHPVCGSFERTIAKEIMDKLAHLIEVKP